MCAILYIYYTNDVPVLIFMYMYLILGFSTTACSASSMAVIVTFTEADYELVDDKHLCTSSPKSTNKLYRDFSPLYLESLYQAHAVTNQTKNKQIKKRTRKDLGGTCIE